MYLKIGRFHTHVEKREAIVLGRGARSVFQLVPGGGSQAWMAPSDCHLSTFMPLDSLPTTTTPAPLRV